MDAVTRPAHIDDQASQLTTPAFVYDEARLHAQLDLFRQLCAAAGARLLYSVKAQPFAGLLQLIAPASAGFSVSSLFEARLAFAVWRANPEQRGQIHLTTPGLRPAELHELGQLCDVISFNSLEQCRRSLADLPPEQVTGIRVNPGHSVIGDARYDPCRPRSKLGVPLEQLADALAEDRPLAQRISGIHFHNHFASSDAMALQVTLRRLEAALGKRLGALDWINMGGGYRPRNPAEATALGQVMRTFRERHGLTVWLEPGKAIVGPAGSLVSTVVDCFEREGQSIAVLDTGVQHLPEVFEYQQAPPLREHLPDGAYFCLLVGSTCLAGDIFGEYRLAAPPRVGDRLCFDDVGAYSLIKASRFNGYDLPTLYLREAGGALRRMKTFGYADYQRQWSA